MIERKLEQLCEAELVDKVIVSTDDDGVKRIAEAIRALGRKDIEIIDRPPEFAIDDTLDAFLAYVPTIMPEGVTAWTHVTSPFFGARAYDQAIAQYRINVEAGEFDSLMTVTPIRSFLWTDEGCISHDRNKIRWPRTQDLPKFYDVNSALFMMSRAKMLETQDRIGERPFLLETGARESFDIDWQEDFDLAQMMLNID